MYSQAILTKKWIIALLCINLLACGGSKNFDLPEELKDTTPPSVDSSYPNDDTADNFEVDFKVEILFSELMNPDSLIAETAEESGVKLYSGIDDLSTEASLELRESLISLSVVPLSSINIISGLEEQIPATQLTLIHASGRFALNTNYTVLVESPARDIVEDDLDTAVDERNFILGSSSVSFTTEKGEWKSELSVPNISIENEGTENAIPIIQEKNQYSPLVISNAKGDTFVLWRQEISPGITQLWVSRYTANNKKWALVTGNDPLCNETLCANSVLISNDQISTNVLDYSASINENGQLAIAWSQAEVAGGFVSIWAKLFDGKKWLSIEEISGTGLASTGNSDSPQIQIDQQGNAVAVWREHDGQYSRIKTNIYKLGSDSVVENGQWIEAPSFIDGLSQAYSRPPTLTLSKKGLAIAVWAKKTADNYNIYSNHLRLNQNVVWSDEERIDQINPSLSEYEIGDSSLPKIAIDENNDAIAIWLKHDGQRNNLWYNRFAGSWGAEADYVERDRLGDAAFPSIKFSRSNIALASWIQESTKTKKLMSSFFNVNSTGWEAQKTIDSSNTLAKPISSFDREGNAVVIWQSKLTKGDVNVSYFSKLTESWDSPQTLASNVNDLSIAPIMEDGRFLSVWETESNSSFRLNSALFSD